MSKAIIRGFKTQKEASIYLEGFKDGRNFPHIKDDERCILDDREYCGEWTVNIE